MSSKIIVPEIGEGQIIQAYIREKPIIHFFGSFICEGEELRKILTENDINFQTFQPKLRASSIQPEPFILDTRIPVMSGKEYKIEGMGHYKVNKDYRNNRTELYLTGKSNLYHLGINRNFEHHIKDQLPGFVSFRYSRNT